MLNLKTDLYDRVLKPAGIKFCYDPSYKQYVEIHNLPQKWQLIVPESVQDVLGMRMNSCLSYIATGRASNHHDTTDSNRTRLKNAMKGYGSFLYEKMDEHIYKMLTINAAAEQYMKVTHCIHTVIKMDVIDQIISTYKDEITSLSNDYVERIGHFMCFMAEDIKADSRLSVNMISYIISCINASPLKAFAILAFLSLFESDDKDSLFYRDFEFHYLPNKFYSSGSSENDMTGIEYRSFFLNRSLIEHILLSKSQSGKAPEESESLFSLPMEVMRIEEKIYAVVRIK